MLFAFVNSLSRVPTHSFPSSALTTLFELGAHKFLPLVSNEYHGRTNVLDPPFGDALHYRRARFVPDRNAQMAQRAPTHRVAENDFGAILRHNLEKIHTDCLVEAEGPWQRYWKLRLDVLCLRMLDTRTPAARSREPLAGRG